jgi:urease accessory protein
MRAGVTFATAGVAALFAIEPAQAHILAGDGLAAGFAHPFEGLDHMLAMVAVGAWATQLGGRAIWAVPCAFVGAMILGGFAGMAGLAIPAVELGVTGSVLLLGVLIASGRSIPLPAAGAIVAIFAVLHGHTHGTEIPEMASAGAYAAGFVAATSLLHAAGVGFGWLLAQKLSATALRIAGVALAVVGTGMLLV